MRSGSGTSTPYYPDKIIDGITVSFAHLEPMPFTLYVKRLSRELAVDVRFANHCFSETPVAAFDRSWLIMDDHRERVFCWDRYELSKRLPGMIETLPKTSVWVTPRERNYVYYIMLEGQQNAYPMFFNLRKGGIQDLRMYVESAYPMDEETLKRLVKSSQKVSFPILCAKIFRGERLRFNAPR